MKQILQLPPGLEGNVTLYVNSGYPLRAHHHDELEVNLVLKGSAVYLMDERKYEMRRDTQIWLFPAQDHVLMEQSRDFEMWVAVFSPRLLRRVCRDGASRVLLKDRLPGEFCKQLSGSSAKGISELMDEVAAARGDPSRFNAGLGYALFVAWSAQMLADERPGRDIHSAVEQAARLVRDHAQAISLPQLADQVGLSASRLSRLFRRQTGVSLVHFRQQQQLERFMRIYGDGHIITMLTAALRAGFGSYAQFHRVFKNLTGRSPQEFRRENMSKDEG